MKKFVSDYRFLSIISGVLFGIALTKINFVLGWLCFAPLLCSLNNLSVKKHFVAGFLAAAATGVISFWWMIGGAEKFTGNSSIYGVAAYLFFVVLTGVYFGLVNLTFGLLKLKRASKHQLLINTLLAASIYTVWEALLLTIANTFPWINFHSANPLLSNLYAVQPASLFGIHIISFVAVAVNYLVAECFISKSYVQLWKPAVVVCIYMLCGFGLYQMNDNDQAVSSFKLSLLCENIPPEVRWDSSSGDRLVQELIELDKKATAIKPDVALWSESAVPWTYRPDDDLVNEFLRISKPANITHILGINTDYEGNVVYNSVYCLLPNGEVTSRYDKRYLLGMIEAPFAGIIFPFLSSNGFLVEAGNKSEPLTTPYGKAGIMICNESAVSVSAADAVHNGAEFLCNLSNDGWFSDTYLADLHFYYARLRAVETRKDAAINSNDGWCGFIQSSGKIIEQKRSAKPEVITGSIQPNSTMPLAAAIPFLWVYICSFFIMVISIIKLRSK